MRKHHNVEIKNKMKKTTYPGQRRGAGRTWWLETIPFCRSMVSSKNGYTGDLFLRFLFFFFSVIFFFTKTSSPSAGIGRDGSMKKGCIFVRGVQRRERRPKKLCWWVFVSGLVTGRGLWLRVLYELPTLARTVSGCCYGCCCISATRKAPNGLSQHTTRHDFFYPRTNCTTPEARQRTLPPDISHW